MNSDVAPNENELENQSEEKSPKNESVEVEVSLDPGSILCAAREAKQLNRAQVGQRLGLTETAVKSLERNKFDYFPSGVYARGYLKNYAKFMDLDVDELADMHDQYCQESGLDTGKSHLKPAPRSSSENSVGMKVVAALIVIAAIAAGFYYMASSA